MFDFIKEIILGENEMQAKHIGRIFFVLISISLLNIVNQNLMAEIVSMLGLDSVLYTRVLQAIIECSFIIGLITSMLYIPILLIFIAQSIVILFRSFGDALEIIRHENYLEKYHWRVQYFKAMNCVANFFSILALFLINPEYSVNKAQEYYKIFMSLTSFNKYASWIEVFYYALSISLVLLIITDTIFPYKNPNKKAVSE